MQSPVHDSSQLPLQLLEQLPLHPLQLWVVFFSPSSLSQEENKPVPKIARPKIGKDALAASLKNSRRDWSSSLFNFLSMVKEF